MVVESWYNDIYNDIYPKNSEWWKSFGEDKEAQKWHIHYYGELYK